MRAPKLPKYLRQEDQAQTKEDRAKKTKRCKTKKNRLRKIRGKLYLSKLEIDDNLVDPNLLNNPNLDRSAKKSNIDVNTFQDLVDLVHQKVSQKDLEDTIDQVRTSLVLINTSIDRLKISVARLKTKNFFLTGKHEDMERLVQANSTTVGLASPRISTINQEVKKAITHVVLRIPIVVYMRIYLDANHDSCCPRPLF